MEICAKISENNTSNCEKINHIYLCHSYPIPEIENEVIERKSNCSYSDIAK